MRQRPGHLVKTGPRVGLSTGLVQERRCTVRRLAVVLSYPDLGRQGRSQIVSAGAGLAGSDGMTRCVFPSRPERPVGLLVVRARPRDRTPNLLGSHRALVKTGAVRVRWDREQLIGGKPPEARK